MADSTMLRRPPGLPPGGGPEDGLLVEECHVGVSGDDTGTADLGFLVGLDEAGVLVPGLHRLRELGAVGALSTERALVADGSVSVVSTADST
ncbi:MAG: hypothetical protein QF637_03070 [Acidimicrobiales bacterium]|nr:hypothetical protein [Acidimicrobiales bacterium]